MLMTMVACGTALAWAWLLFGHGNYWHIVLGHMPNSQPIEWPDVAIVVPARDEAAMLPQTLPALLAMDYPGNFRIILVDDNSSDATTDIAMQLAAEQPKGRLQVVVTTTLPQGWSGKVNAMQTGFEAAGNCKYVMFTDADILHQPTSLRHLVARSEERNLDLHSWMVKLHCGNFWEKLLVPAYVYFFQMLYPFVWSNDGKRRTAAAAGGVMLVRTEALKAIGGLESIKGEIIDDCALARAIKFRALSMPERPARTLLSLVDHEAVSLRVYNSLGELWRLIRRAAYTQLRYSPVLLIGAFLGLVLLFIAPIVLAMAGGIYALTGWLVLVAMIYSYLPMIEFYRRNVLWGATLPLAALIYAGAMFDSARLYVLGKGGQWKGRAQAGIQKP